MKGKIIKVAIYKKFFTFFIEKGYTEGIDLFEFPYDWRKDMEVSSEKLGLFIQDILDKTRHNKVILIAHHLGGVVAKSLIMRTSIHKNIEKLFLLGTPHHGAPKYLSLLLFGKEWPLPWIIVKLNEQDAKQLVHNFQAYI